MNLSLSFWLVAHRGIEPLVTAGGKRFLERYERFRQEVQDAAQRLFTECFEGGDTNETD